MSDIVFKRLFEVQILHDYFLTETDGSSFFGKNKAEKSAQIQEKLIHGLYDIRKYFSIRPTDKTKRRLSEYKILWFPTALGFLVGMEVSVENQAGAVFYKPKIEIDPDLRLSFSVQPKLPFFEAITSLSFQPALPSKFYFTNKDKEEFDENAVPNYTSLSLAKKVRVHQPGSQYEMGNLVDFAGTVKEALQKTDGNTAAHWENAEDKRFITEADRLLLPRRFAYTLKKEDGITDLTAKLEDPLGNEVKTLNLSSADPLVNPVLRFEKVDDTDENSAEIAKGDYKLKITVGGTPEITYEVLLDDDLYSADGKGIVDIRADELDSPFSLLDAAGFLKTRIDAANVKTPHPVFELRFKNRRTYWRYRKEGDFSPAEITATAAHLDHRPERLISKKPKALTETLVPFINGAALVLPHPRYPSVRVEGDKIYSEIYIHQSNRLLNN